MVHSTIIQLHCKNKIQNKYS